ncbi:MAG: hypothetical protein KA770_00445 [Shewanella sp.]|nr:hypothetical protein [Shewanella sp.]
MVNRTFGNLGLHKAGFFLALFSFPLFAYTPPATPNLPLSFEFLGPNAEAESTAFYNTQCDSKNFSWYGTDWFCAVGDPANPVCYVKMAYFSTDVNQCQAYVPPEQPTPHLEPDRFTEKGGSNQNLISKLELMRIQDFNKNYEDGQYQNTDLALSRQNNSLLSSLNRTLQYANDNRSIVDAINTWGATLKINDDSLALRDKEFWQTRHLKEDFNFSNQMGGITSYLGELNGLQYNINEMNSSLKTIAGNSNGGGDGGSGINYTDLLYNLKAELSSISNATSNLYGLSGNMSGQASNIIGNAHSDSAKEQALLTSLNESIASLEGSLEGSSKNIIDAIEKGSGNGTAPDSISETGCAAFSCSSNTPQCYIARKEWERSCATAKADSDGKGLVDSLVSSVKEYNESPDSDIQNIDAGVINTDALLNKYTNANGFNAGGQQTCPAPLPLDIGIAVLHIDLSPMCDLAAVISWFVIATAMLSSGLAIAKYS